MSFAAEQCTFGCFLFMRLITSHWISTAAVLDTGLYCVVMACSSFPDSNKQTQYSQSVTRTRRLLVTSWLHLSTQQVKTQCHEILHIRWLRSSVVCNWFWVQKVKVTELESWSASFLMMSSKRLYILIGSSISYTWHPSGIMVWNWFQKIKVHITQNCLSSNTTLQWLSLYNECFPDSFLSPTSANLEWM